MPRLAVLLGLLAALATAGCGGGSGEPDGGVPGVEAFPDVLEIARAELGEDAALLEVTVTEKDVSFLHVQLGRSTSYTYNAKGVFVGSKRGTKPVQLAQTFSISTVSVDAPARILAGIAEREDGAVQRLAATLARDRSGTVRWSVRTTVDGSAKEYEAAPDGTLAG